MNVRDSWPFPYKPRHNQELAFDWLSNQEATYLLLEAPVGAGKSNIGITYSRALGNGRGSSYILTPQRILQEQYEQSFANVDKIDVATLYGKSNYTCARKNTSCDIGTLVKPQCKGCPFKIAKKAAQLAQDTVLNYRLALTSFAFTPTFKDRKLMILDECHTLENQLVDFDALQIAQWRCKKYDIAFKMCKGFESALDWMKEYYIPLLQRAVSKLEDECEPLFNKQGDELTRREIRMIRELSSLHDHFDETVAMSIRTPEYINQKFVLVWDAMKFQFKRLTGAHSFHKIVTPKAKRFLFMSSTILDLEGFCADLGIPEDQAAFLSLGSEFPKDNRRVYYMPQMKMNAKWKEPEQADSRKGMLKAVRRVLDMHKEDTGLIHTGNFAIADWLTKNLEFSVDHKVFQHNPGNEIDRNDAINGFTDETDPSILISPSCTEGLDLKEDLGRFVIFLKVPFGFLGDQWIRRRMDMSIRWYHRRALIDVIQGGGRIVRSDTDWGNVYILDQSWAFLYKQAYHMIPHWWREAYGAM